MSNRVRAGAKFLAREARKTASQVDQERKRIRKKLDRSAITPGPTPTPVPKPTKVPNAKNAASGDVPARIPDRPTAVQSVHTVSAQQWRKLRPRVIREEQYCRLCWESRGAIRPGEQFKAEASEVAKVDPHRAVDRPNLMAICAPCSKVTPYLDAAMELVMPGDGDTPSVVVVDDPHDILKARAEAVPDSAVADHRLLGKETRDHATGTHAVQLERRVEALRLRMAGADYRTIRQELMVMGISVSLKQVYDDVQEALTELAKQERVAAEEIRELELARLDAMWMALWPDIERGDVFAIQTGLKVMERRAKMLGLDSAQKVQIDGRPLQDLPQDQLDARATAIMRRIAMSRAQLMGLPTPQTIDIGGNSEQPSQDVDSFVGASGVPE
jgi:5-methylcytosine-specific restriction endonuclease McrA